MKLAVITPTCRSNPRYAEMARTLFASFRRAPPDTEIQWIIVDERCWWSEAIARMAEIDEAAATLPGEVAQRLSVHLFAPPPSNFRGPDVSDPLPAHNTARNAGLEAVDPDAAYVIILSDCSAVTADWITVALDLAKQGLGWKCRATTLFDHVIPKDQPLKYQDCWDSLHPVRAETVAGPCWGVPREAIMAAGGFDSDYDGEDDLYDQEVLLRLARVGVSFVTTKRAGVVRMNRTRLKTEVTTRSSSLRATRNQSFYQQLKLDRDRVLPGAIAAAQRVQIPGRGASDRAPRPAPAPVRARVAPVGPPRAQPNPAGRIRPGPAPAKPPAHLPDPARAGDDDGLQADGTAPGALTFLGDDDPTVTKTSIFASPSSEPYRLQWAGQLAGLPDPRLPIGRTTPHDRTSCPCGGRMSMPYSHATDCQHFVPLTSESWKTPGGHRINTRLSKMLGTTIQERDIPPDEDSMPTTPPGCPEYLYGAPAAVTIAAARAFGDHRKPAQETPMPTTPPVRPMTLHERAVAIRDAKKQRAAAEADGTAPPLEDHQRCVYVPTQGGNKGVRCEGKRAHGGAHRYPALEPAAVAPPAPARPAAPKAAPVPTPVVSREPPEPPPGVGLALDKIDQHLLDVQLLLAPRPNSIAKNVVLVAVVLRREGVLADEHTFRVLIDQSRASLPGYEKPNETTMQEVAQICATLPAMPVTVLEFRSLNAYAKVLDHWRKQTGLQVRADLSLYDRGYAAAADSGIDIAPADDLRTLDDELANLERAIAAGEDEDDIQSVEPLTDEQVAQNEAKEATLKQWNDELEEVVGPDLGGETAGEIHLGEPPPEPTN